EASFELASSAATVDASGVVEPGEVHAADDAVGTVLAAVVVVPCVGAVRLGQPLAWGASVDAERVLSGLHSGVRSGLVLDPVAGDAVVVTHSASLAASVHL